MSRFRFTVINPVVRQEGTIESQSFSEAVEGLWKHVEVQRGDVLEIGVKGFPPARYQCLGSLVTGKPLWRAA
jgi:hypothetical protein